MPPDTRPLRILHLSDTHIGANGFDEDGVDAVAALRCLLDTLAHVPDLDLVLVTGDIADDGSEQGCVLARDAIGRFAADRGIPTSTRRATTIGGPVSPPRWAAGI